VVITLPSHKQGWKLTGKPVDDVCSPVPRQCKRPCGVHFHYFKLSAGFAVGSGILGPLFSQSNMSWVETYTLAHPKTDARLRRAQESRWPTVTVLRDPLERLLAQYFATAETEAEYLDLGLWVEKHSAPPPRFDRM